jgi:hypothetical protein
MKRKHTMKLDYKNRDAMRAFLTDMQAAHGALSDVDGLADGQKAFGKLIDEFARLAIEHQVACTHSDFTFARIERMADLLRRDRQQAGR